MTTKKLTKQLTITPTLVAAIEATGANRSALMERGAWMVLAKEYGIKKADWEKKLGTRATAQKRGRE
jgi:hypothetical protein